MKNIILNLTQATSELEAGRMIEEEIKSFFISGDYQMEVKINVEWNKDNLKQACREAAESLYQSEWNIEVKVAEENQDGTWNVEIVDLDEEE